MNLFKKSISALLCVGLMVSCSSDDSSIETSGSAITNLEFTIEASGLGNTVSVTPTALGATSYSVDFGNTEVTDDVLATVGPKVTYVYPSLEATYNITVTASSVGVDNATLTKEYTVAIAVPQTNVVGRWVLDHSASSLYLGSATGQYWWGNTIADVTTRSCLYDDVYEFKADGSFENILGESTWLEAWHGTVDEEQCGTPVAPYDGTATATWFHNETEGTITLNGKGAYLGLSKVINGSEISGPTEAVESIEYTNVIISEDKNTLSVEAHYATAADGTAAIWKFTFAREGSAGASIPETDTDGDGVIDAEDACPDFAGTEPNGCPGAMVGQDPKDDFEGTGNVTWVGDGLTIDSNFANPSVSGINTSSKVLQYVDDGSGQYANMRFDLNEAKTDYFDLSTKNVFKVKVYVPTPDIAHTQPKQLAVKLQDGSSASPWEGQVEIIQTYEYDTWQELTFDFSAQSAETKFTRVVLQFNSENNFEPVTAYVDDFTYSN